MKHHYKHPCNRLARTLALALQLSFYILHLTLYTSHAAVPVAWTNSPGMPPYPIKPVPHGVPVDFRVTLKGYTEPLIAPGADLHLWYQTNGMGKLWWPAPAALEGDTITATFGPAQDCGADRVSLFFGAPSNVFASAVLRLTHAPGFDPARLPLPVQYIDFAAVELRNLSALTNGWSFGSTPGNYETVSNRAMFAVATNRYGNATVGLWDFPGGLAVGEANDGFRSFLYPVSGGLDVTARDQAETIYHFGFDGVQTDDDVLRRKDLPAPPDLSGYATVDALGAVDDTARAAADAATNYTDAAIADADTTYRRTVGVTNLNQSVQYVNITDAALSTLQIQLPTNGETKDWMVYVSAATNVTISLPPATWWMADVAYTNAVPGGKPTALWFSQVSDGIYILGRQELTEVQLP